jgi:hypothetical protein
MYSTIKSGDLSNQRFVIWLGELLDRSNSHFGLNNNIVG